MEEARSGRKKVMAVMTSLSPETSGATRSRERSGVGEEHSPTFTPPPMTRTHTPTETRVHTRRGTRDVSVSAHVSVCTRGSKTAPTCSAPNRQVNRITQHTRSLAARACVCLCLWIHICTARNRSREPDSDSQDVLSRFCFLNFRLIRDFFFFSPGGCCPHGRENESHCSNFQPSPDEHRVSQSTLSLYMRLLMTGALWTRITKIWMK